ncbi:Uncharacterized conserved protein, contains ParB-like and HNH nuclease domains [Allochromatium warmingii]|uniref:Uncharacterized conserved protein, contains ParB-like and HNH nuclease domains n=1 Tax=Allochromatium warmingii TaxID=61595 RepID=A0A1H3FB75_ALLWA|nr:DUF262 domain-containing protein [Allochromatium warmingii]SDX87618.1 Uncharacterized conserved protein, contains ParB-like and HNH nuclease domains [Allochromatium warmingii]
MPMIVNNYQISQIFNIDLNVAYKVPLYQREYIWSKMQWESLFDDLLENNPDYFIGSIICINPGNDALAHVRYLEIVDGQQRLTTISLLFAALYYSLKNHEDKNQVSHTLYTIERKLVFDGVLRISPQIQNHNLSDYKSILAKINLIAEANPVAFAGNRRFFKAFNYFVSRIQEFELENSLDLIMSFINKLNRACLVKIEVESHSDAYTLFESLNNRGMPLTAIDLIKNKLLSRLENEENSLEQYSEIWNNILNNLGDDYATQERFFRQYYNAFKDELNEPFRNKQNHQNPLGLIAKRSNLIWIYEKLIDNNAKQHLNDLSNASRWYSLMLGRRWYSLILSNSEYSLVLNNENELVNLEKPFKDLERIQGSPSYLLMLYLLIKRQDLSINQFCEIINLLVSFFVRRNLTDKPPTRDLTRLFMNIVENLSQYKNSDVVENIRSELLGISVEDEEFREKLSSDIYKENANVARFILCKLAEQGMTKENWVDLWAERSKQFLWSIEHIFPQGENIPDAWVEMIADGDKNKAQEFKETHIHKLGNLTLSGFNSNLSNRSFKEKRDLTDQRGLSIGYKNGLNLNAELVNLESWTIKNIDERTEQLVNQSMKLFSLQSQEKVS